MTKSNTPSQPPKEVPMPSDPLPEATPTEVPQPKDPLEQPATLEVPEVEDPPDDEEYDPFDEGNFPV